MTKRLVIFCWLIVMKNINLSLHKDSQNEAEKRNLQILKGNGEVYTKIWADNAKSRKIEIIFNILSS